MLAQPLPGERGSRRGWPIGSSGGQPHSLCSASRQWPPWRPTNTPTISCGRTVSQAGRPHGPAHGGRPHLREFDGDARLGTPKDTGSYAGAVAARLGHRGEAHGRGACATVWILNITMGSKGSSKIIGAAIAPSQRKAAVKESWRGTGQRRAQTPTPPSHDFRILTWSRPIMAISGWVVDL